MLKRKITIGVLVIAAVAVAYFVFVRPYDESDERGATRPVETYDVQLPPKGASIKVGSGRDHVEYEQSRNVNIERRARDGSLISRFIAVEVRAISETEAAITRPEIYHYTSEGATIVITADTGVYDTGGKGLSFKEMNKGRLAGNVRIRHDRGTPADKSDDINIAMDHLDFTEKMKLLTTDGDVTVDSPEIHVTAKKMRLRLEEDSRQFKTLSLLEDVRITLLQTGGAGAIGLQGAPARRKQPAPPPIGEKKTPEARKTFEENPPPGRAPDRKGAESFYRIVMENEVRAVQGEMQLACDHLLLYSGKGGVPGLAGADAAPDVPPVAAGPAAEQPKTAEPVAKPEAPSDDVETPATEPLVVTCRGPLVITPVTEVAPDEDRDEVVAKGKLVVITQGESTMTAQVVRFNTTRQTVVATDSRNVKLAMADEFQLAGPRMDFDRAKGVLLITGAGNLEGKVNSNPEGKAPAKGEKQPPMKAKWSESMKVVFAELPAGGTRAEAGKATIKTAEFVGNAVLSQGDGFIKAQKVTMQFEPDLAKAGGESAPSNRLKELVATGGVHIAQADMEARGDYIRRDVARGLFELRGKPAAVKQGQMRLTGKQIVYNEVTKHADVRGAGTLTMPVNSNLQGKPLDKPQNLLIKWADGMTYRDDKNFANFSGAVNARVGDDTLSSKQLWVYFEPVPQSKPAKGTDGAMPVGQKRVSRILSTGDVTARTVQSDPRTGAKLREVTIKCQSLTFRQDGKEGGKGQVSGPGTLTIVQKETGKKGPDTWKGVPPNKRPPEGFSKTTVAWKKAAVMSRSEQVGFFEGAVVAEHMGRSLAGPEAGKTTQQASVIKSDRMWLVFNKPKAGAEKSEIQFSKLSAVGNASFASGIRSATGHSITYSEAEGKITIMSGAEGFARFVVEDEETQQFNEAVAKKIFFWPATQKAQFVELKSMTGSPQ